MSPSASELGRLGRCSPSPDPWRSWRWRSPKVAPWWHFQLVEAAKLPAESSWLTEYNTLVWTHNAHKFSCEKTCFDQNAFLYYLPRFPTPYCVSIFSTKFSFDRHHFLRTHLVLKLLLRSSAAFSFEGGFTQLTRAQVSHYMSLLILWQDFFPTSEDIPVLDDRFVHWHRFLNAGSCRPIVPATWCNDSGNKR